MQTRERIINYIKENLPLTVRENKEDTEALLGLPYPYSVPGLGGVFQEMYYWDTYFINVGLLLSNETEQAKNNVDNMIYLVNKYGFVPNSNRTWGLARSQPPFLSEMVRDVFDITGDLSWLSKCYTALKKEYNFWQSERNTPCGLNRYFGKYPDPDFICGRLCARLNIEKPTDENLVIEYANSFHSGAESGWDFSSRCGLYQHKYVWLDLNSLLYGVERNMEYFSSILGLNEEKLWCDRAKCRLDLMNKLLWNEDLGVFCDYNYEDERNTGFVSLAMLYPLLVGIATEKQAKSTREKLEKIELRYGITCCESRDDLYNLQWDRPHVWPPLQIIAIKALSRYGYTEDTKRIARKYLDVVELNFEKHGCLWEKYNGTDGEVSKTKEYETPPMMGWCAAAYLYCDKLLNG